MANQQANMVAALGSADASYLRVGSLGGIKHLPSLSSSGQFQNNVFRSLPVPYGGMMGRLNTPAGLGVHGLPSSGVLQLGHAQNLNNSMNDPLKFQPAMAHHVNQHGGSIQGIPVVSVGLDQLHPNKDVSPISNMLPDPRTRVASGCSRTPLTNNGLMVEPNHPQETQGLRGYENLPSLASQHSEFSLPLMENNNGRCTDNWASAVQSSGMHTSSYSTNECFHVGNPSGASSITSLSTQSHDSMSMADNMHSQAPIFTNSTPNASFQRWVDHSLDSLIPVNGAVGSSSSGFQRNLDFNFGNPLEMKQDGVTKSAEDTLLKPNQGYHMDPHKPQRSRVSNNLGSLEDLVSAMMKQVIITFEQNIMKLLPDEFLYDMNLMTVT